MLLGMVTLVNITLVGALVSLVGNIPDSSFLVILSRYLRRKEESAKAILYPVEAVTRLELMRRKMVIAFTVSGIIAGGFTVWALAVGWGTAFMLAITFWVIAGNLAFLDVPLGLWKRRAGRMPEHTMEEAMLKALSATPAEKVDGGGPNAGEDAGGGGEIDTNEDRA